ncbi:MAG: Na+-dependent transporter [archaeon]|nr:Na+-dependent transporter [archaeon]
MDFWECSTDVRIYVAAGIVLAFVVGSLGESVATLSILVLMMQMSASIHGLHIERDAFRSRLGPSLVSFLCCFGICTLSSLAMGVFFIDSYPGMWYGWVMLAAVPPAVSVVTIALMMRGDMAMTMISMVIIYGLALVITPVMTMTLIGDAVSPLEILKYIVLFIAIPVIANIPLGRIRIEKRYKVTFINVMMFLLLLFSLGRNRDFILQDGAIVLVIIGACILRTFGVGTLMLYLFRRFNVDRDRVVVYVGYAVWKNSGLATSMCMLLLVDIPEAALPCAISLVIEAVWFAVTNKSMALHWPADEPSVSHRIN